MRAIGILVCVGVVVLIATMSSSKGDGQATGSPAVEPITGTAVMPFKGAEQPMKDPFTPMSYGPPEAAWPRESLTADEQTVADRGKTVDYTAVHTGYGAAARGNAAKAAADAAAIHLGIDDLATTGVVP